MASFYWTRSVVRSLLFTSVVENVLDWVSPEAPQNSDMVSLNASIEAGIIPLMNALQHQSLENVSVFSQRRDIPGVQHLEFVTGTGDLTATETAPVAQFSLYMRQNTDGFTTQFSDGGAVDVQRSIVRGGLFLPGITEDWMANGLPVTPVGLATDLAALCAALIATIVTPDVNFIPMVHGFALPAITGAHPKPAREECFAAIATVAYRNVSWLRSRKGIY